MSLIPDPIRPYLPLIKVGLVLLALGGVYWYAHHQGVSSERKEWEAKVSEARQSRIDDYEAKILVYKTQLATEQGRTTALTATISGLQTSTERLSAALARAGLVTREANPNGDPVVRLSRAFRLCVTAGTLGTESTIASCEAFGVPKPPAP
jgi:hypothetical protein